MAVVLVHDGVSLAARDEEAVGEKRERIRAYGSDRHVATVVVPIHGRPSLSAPPS
jgi:hypothetical protein